MDPDKIINIFHFADTNKDGFLSEEEFTALVVLLNPNTPLEDRHLALIREEVWNSYAAHVEAAGLRIEGFRKIYEEGCADAERDYQIVAEFIAEQEVETSSIVSEGSVSGLLGLRDGGFREREPRLFDSGPREEPTPAATTPSGSDVFDAVQTPLGLPEGVALKFIYPVKSEDRRMLTNGNRAVTRGRASTMGSDGVGGFHLARSHEDPRTTLAMAIQVNNTSLEAEYDYAQKIASNETSRDPVLAALQQALPDGASVHVVNEITTSRGKVRGIVCRFEDTRNGWEEMEYFQAVLEADPGQIFQHSTFGDVGIVAGKIDPLCSATLAAISSAETIAAATLAGNTGRSAMAFAIHVASTSASEFQSKKAQTFLEQLSRSMPKDSSARICQILPEMQAGGAVVVVGASFPADTNAKKVEAQKFVKKIERDCSSVFDARAFGATSMVSLQVSDLVPAALGLTVRLPSCEESSVEDAVPKIVSALEEALPDGTSAACIRVRKPNESITGDATLDLVASLPLYVEGEEASLAAAHIKSTLRWIPESALPLGAYSECVACGPALETVGSARMNDHTEGVNEAVELDRCKTPNAVSNDLLHFGLGLGFGEGVAMRSCSPTRRKRSPQPRHSRSRSGSPVKSPRSLFGRIFGRGGRSKEQETQLKESMGVNYNVTVPATNPASPAVLLAPIDIAPAPTCTDASTAYLSAPTSTPPPVGRRELEEARGIGLRVSPSVHAENGDRSSLVPPGSFIIESPPSAAMLAGYQRRSPSSSGSSSGLVEVVTDMTSCENQKRNESSDGAVQPPAMLAESLLGPFPSEKAASKTSPAIHIVAHAGNHRTDSCDDETSSMVPNAAGTSCEIAHEEKRNSAASEQVSTAIEIATAACDVLEERDHETRAPLGTSIDAGMRLTDGEKEEEGPSSFAEGLSMSRLESGGHCSQDASRSPGKRAFRLFSALSPSRSLQHEDEASQSDDYIFEDDSVHDDASTEFGEASLEGVVARDPAILEDERADYAEMFAATDQDGSSNRRPSPKSKRQLTPWELQQRQNAKECAIMDAHVRHMVRQLEAILANPQCGAAEISYLQDGLSMLPLWAQHSAHMEMGERLFIVGMFQEAMRSFKEATNIWPGDPLARFRLGNTCFVLHLYNQAARQYYNAMRCCERDDPLQVKIHVNMGISLECDGRLKAAEREYRIASELAPAHPRVHKLLGSVRCALGDAEGAVKSLLRALELIPDFVDAWVDMGCAKASLGRTSEAKECFLRALALNKNHLEARFNLANLLRQAGNASEALPHFDAALALDPDHWRSWLGKAVALGLLPSSGNPGVDDARRSEAHGCLQRAIDLSGAGDRVLAEEVDRLRRLIAVRAGADVLSEQVDAIEERVKEVAVSASLASRASPSRKRSQLSRVQSSSSWAATESQGAGLRSTASSRGAGGIVRSRSVRSFSPLKASPELLSMWKPCVDGNIELKDLRKDVVCQIESMKIDPEKVLTEIDIGFLQSVQPVTYISLASIWEQTKEIETFLLGGGPAVSRTSKQSPSKVSGSMINGQDRNSAISRSRSPQKSPQKTSPVKGKSSVAYRSKRVPLAFAESIIRRLVPCTDQHHLEHQAIQALYDGVLNWLTDVFGKVDASMLLCVLVAMVDAPLRERTTLTYRLLMWKQSDSPDNVNVPATRESVIEVIAVLKMIFEREHRVYDTKNKPIRAADSHFLLYERFAADLSKYFPFYQALPVLANPLS